MKEVWRPVRGYEGLYEVSDLGRVRSLARIVKHPRGDQRKPEKLMKLVPDPVYYRVGLRKDGKTKPFRIHTLVAYAFLPDPPGPVGNRGGCYQVDHINENKFDNRAVNLRWVTMEWNSYHRYGDAHVLHKHSSHPGERHGMSKLVAEQVLAIRADDRPHKEIAADYGVDSTQIGHIKCRRSWKHL